ncbi:MAG: ABC transporter ATP-binding protein [Hyphomicrobiaceae bacterium]|nr:ABC transporter ATP-binding protein [Hyphomicrobiaceae bacterium]
MKTLEVRNLKIAYGNVLAVDGITCRVGEGQVVCILGANGAGKSSLLKCIVGLVRPAGGQVLWDGEDVTGLPPHEMTRRGVTLSAEGRRLFPELTVRENLLMGAYLRPRDAAFRADLERVYGWFPRLKERSRQAAGSLSGGEQQMCAIGRALMSAPKVLLLDEPSLGLSPLATREVTRIISEIARAGMTTVLVEQNARMALGLSQYGYVLETGRLALQGPASELLDNPWIKDIYLGGSGPSQKVVA